MKALEIKDMRRFMSGFLAGSLFDRFLLVNARITTFCTFSIDGRLQKAFFEDPDQKEGSSPDAADPTGNAEAGAAAEKPAYVPWTSVKARCFDIFKGKRQPLAFHFVLSLPENLIPAFLAAQRLPAGPETVSGLGINLRFERKHLILTTGTTLTSFTPDRSVAQSWDEYVCQLLARAGIETEVLA